MANRRQGIYWILTVPFADLPTPTSLPESCSWFRGQLEVGEGGFRHWQILVAFRRKSSLSAVKSLWPTAHAELTRSDAAVAYVWKESTRVSGTQFEFGGKPFQRGSPVDWECVRTLAMSGELDSRDIPPDVFIRCYSALRKIAGDFAKPVGITRRIKVFCGPTATGKSRRAWDEAGFDAYPKNPNTKFWDGYRGHRHVVCDEYRGRIDISYLLTWTDRYPVLVEVKGSSVVLAAEAIWFTSNIHPRLWYPELDSATVDALLRRLEIVEF